ncbi:hypothetical protein F6Y05_21340 [Bacillus megaterium]|nr:hypothetical protein [Priestia megaterium]
MKKALIFCPALILLVVSAGMYMNHSKEIQMGQKQNDQMFHKAEQAAYYIF